jgi:tetratricopeptide (TPR) repeat protein
LLPILKTILIIIALCGAAGLARAQQDRKPPKTVEVEVKDPQQQAAVLFDLGQKAHEAGKLEEALQLYGEALQRDPELWQAEFQRGVAYFSLNRLPEARASITRVNEQLAQFADSPERRAISARVQIALGEIALAEDKYAEAEKSFRRALEFNPQAGRAHTGLAEVFVESGKFNEAISEAKAAIAAGDDRALTHSLLGEALTLDKNYDEAMASLDEALKREPKNATALRYRAEVFIARNQLPRAVSDLQAALAIEKIAPTMQRLAEVYHQTKQYPEAANLYQQVLASEPTNHQARAALAAVMIESGKLAEAIVELETLIKTQPDQAKLRAQLAELYLAAQPEKALEQYVAAAKLEPAQVRHRIGAGAALVKLRRFQDAANVLRQVLETPPPDEQAYFAHTNLAIALFELEDYLNAAREYLWILDHQKDQKRAAIALYFLGICFDKLGDYEQALKIYERFLESASTDNQLEIDKVKLRLPPLKQQIKNGKSKPVKIGIR